MREINNLGLGLLKQFESCRLNSYQDQKGIWTVGYGSTQIKHPEIVQGLTITLDQAEGYLKKDLEDFYQLDHYIAEVVNENQYSALICLAYNVGLRALKLSKTLGLVNAGARPDPEWMGFNRIDGEISNGLTRRRVAELKLYHTLGG